jgi:heme/copper-type cytochrome/quinol oxidase subunit 1
MPAGRISAAFAAMMRAEYEAPSRPSLADLERRWGWSRNAISTAIMRVGGTVRPSRRVRRVQDRAELLAAYDAGQTRDQIAAAWGITLATVNVVLSHARREAGTSGDTWQRRSTRDRHAQWAEAHAAGEGYRRIARREGVKAQSVRAAVLRMREGAQA